MTVDLELWDPEVHRGNPDAFNAIVQDGRVHVQRVEWQIERRYRFDAGMAAAEGLVRSLTEGGLLAHASVVPVAGVEPERRIVFFDSTGARFELSPMSPGGVFEQCRAMVAAFIDPRPRAVAPYFSRGPYSRLFSPPFP